MNKEKSLILERARLRLNVVALQHDLSIERMAKELGMCRSNFIRAFKKVYAKCPLEYCQEIRLKKAIDLLKEDRYMMKEIADMIGMSSIYHFSKWFKDRTGTSPTNYDANENISLCDY
jgi:AraC-like DNA-binding protein